jgi:dihydrofolate reductase
LPIFHSIVAMSENRVIARDGRIPWRLPEDFRWFKYKTMGSALIMGRKTYEAIGEPLPGRRTVVISRSEISIPGVEICRDLAQLPSGRTDDEEKIWWICGGAQIYRQLMPQTHFIYLTRVKREVEGDVFFPKFEDDFELNQLIHENDQFRVERWLNKAQKEGDPTASEPWPFAR